MYYIYLFIFLIIILLLLIYINIKEYYSIELFYIDREITSIGVSNSDSNIDIYGSDIDFRDFTNVYMDKVTQLCTVDGNGTEKCINTNVRTLPIQKGDTGVCNVETQCTDCSCPNGTQAGNWENGVDNPTICKKRGVQCKKCNAGYYLKSNDTDADNTYTCEPCPSGTWSDRDNRFIDKCIPCKGAQVSVELLEANGTTRTENYTSAEEACELHSHINNCGDGNTGTCETNVCECPGGRADVGTCGRADNTDSEDKISCDLCYAGYEKKLLSKLTPAASPRYECVACGYNKYKNTTDTSITDAGVCNDCPTEAGADQKVADGDGTEHITHYLLSCTKADGPVWETCKACPVGEYRANCGIATGTEGPGIGVRNSGTCEPCAMCERGQYKSDCGLSSIATDPSTTDASATDTSAPVAGAQGVNPGECSICPSCPSGQHPAGCGGYDRDGGILDITDYVSRTSSGNCETCRSATDRTCGNTQHAACISNNADPRDGTCENNVCHLGCPGGWFDPNGCTTHGAKRCDGCNTGYGGNYSWQWGINPHANRSCYQCSAGQYNNKTDGSSCRVCPACQVSNAGSSSCSPANAPTMWGRYEAGMPTSCMGEITSAGHVYGNGYGNNVGKGEKVNIKAGDSVALCANYDTYDNEGGICSRYTCPGGGSSCVYYANNDRSACGSDATCGNNRRFDFWGYGVRV